MSFNIQQYKKVILYKFAEHSGAKVQLASAFVPDNHGETATALNRGTSLEITMGNFLLQALALGF